MKRWIWGWLLAAFALPAMGQAGTDEAEIEWPLPWQAGTVLEYDQAYTTTSRRDGKEITIRATDVVRISIEHAGEDGFVQRWVGTAPEFDLSELPEEMRLPILGMAEALDDLPLDVRLGADGAYQGLADIEELIRRYRGGLQDAFRQISSASLAELEATAEPGAAARIEAMVGRMVDLLTSPQVVEEQFAELPAAYNFVAGGGLAPGVEYEFTSEAKSPADGQPLTMRNTMMLSRTGEPGIYRMRWRIAPDTDEAVAMIGRLAGELMQDIEPGEEARRQAVDDALDAARGNARFGTMVNYRIDASTGVVQWLEHVQIKRFGNKDETTTTVMTLKPGE